ncbi:MAG: GTP-binding protein [Halobacteriovoraceae bacterium]|nr:GTP-binding protein [Halobacteriovoraceae bacterium]|tara:strand:- start:4715 stop:5203 length:489 start_codon:yes stop_codon:yes gene_type:complete
MSELSEPTKVRYFASCLFKSEVEIESHLTSKFKIFDELTPNFNPLISYYEKEMGDQLERKIFIFDQIRERDFLIDAKIWAQNLEKNTSVQGSRILNIDMGYIAKEQVLLATGKPYSHRIYLNQGVFAELVYTYSDKTFKSLPWTYPDYQHPEKIAFFNKFRP